MSNPGFRGGWSWTVPTKNLMTPAQHPGPIETMQGGLRRGVSMAHRGIVYAHQDYRNFARSQGRAAARGVVE